MGGGALDASGGSLKSAGELTVELRELRWAIVASQHRSLRQAAEALNIRQSTLRRALRDLKYKLGATLFERTNGGTRPTVEGQEFLGAARRIVEETETITARLKTCSRGESGRFTIGVHASLSAGNLWATLLEHRHRFPNVETHLVDGSSDHLLSDLANSAIDVAFVADDNPRWSDRSLPVWGERVVIALPEHHHLSRRDADRANGLNETGRWNGCRACAHATRRGGRLGWRNRGAADRPAAQDPRQCRIR